MATGLAIATISMALGVAGDAPFYIAFAVTATIIVVRTLDGLEEE